MTKNTGTVVNKSILAYLQTNQQRQIIGMPHHTTQLPRQVNVATFMQATGHDKLQAHLHRLMATNISALYVTTAEYMQGIFTSMETHACQTVHKTLDRQSVLVYCIALHMMGTAAKSRHWLDDKKIEIDTIIKMLPHHLSYGVLVLLSLSVSLKQNLNINYLLFFHAARQMTSHRNAHISC
jgi:hypothetical protein